MGTGRKMLRIGLGALALLSAGWLAFVIYLDIAYDMFPRVLLGGVKILLAAYLVLFLVLGAAFVLRGLLRRFTGRAKA